MSLGRIEAYLYGSGTVGLLAGTSDLTVTEQTGPVSLTAALSGPLLLSTPVASALASWQGTLNGAGGLNNSYSLAWNSTAQSVTIARTAGISTFIPTFAGALGAALGFSGSLSAGTTFTGTVQASGRFDDLNMAVGPVMPGSREDLKRYRYDRSESLCFGPHDICDITVMLPKVRSALFESSLCVAGRVRVWQNQSLAPVYSPSYPKGYLDGSILSALPIVTLGSSEEWVKFSFRMVIPHA